MCCCSCVRRRWCAVGPLSVLLAAQLQAVSPRPCWPSLRTHACLDGTRLTPQPPKQPIQTCSTTSSGSRMPEGQQHVEQPNSNHQAGWGVNDIDRASHSHNTRTSGQTNKRTKKTLHPQATCITPVGPVCPGFQPSGSEALRDISCAHSRSPANICTTTTTTNSWDGATGTQ